MIKRYLVFLIIMVMSLRAISQDSYQPAIDSAMAAINNTDYPKAIKFYNAAKAFDPSMDAVVDNLINKAFIKIDSLRKAAIYQSKKAEALKIVAEKNLELANEQKLIAENALTISHANQIMYEAQGAVKYDPTLAMHLAATALDSIRGIKMYDSLIFDKASRIYYENNFGETIIGDQRTTLGKFTRAIFWPDENSIWTITDKLFAVNWSNGVEGTKIKLDTNYREYAFKILGKDSLLLYGIDRGTATRKKSIRVWVITNKNTPFSIYTDSTSDVFIAAKSDTISLKAGLDKSEGWAKRLFGFNERVFQFNSNKLKMIDSVSKSVNYVAFSPDGKSIATTNLTRELNIFNSEGAPLSKSILIDTANALEFSPDNKILLVREANWLQFFQVANPNYKSVLYFTGSRLQSYQFSSDSRWLVVSTLSGNQQVIILYHNDYNSLDFKIFAQYRCPGSPQTSAVISKDNKSILSSSDKIRLWTRPQSSTEPTNIETQSEFISSVQMDPIQINQDTTFTCVTFNDRILKYTYSSNGTIKPIDSAFSMQQPGLFTPRLAAFPPYYGVLNRALIVSEDGQLQLYNPKDKTLEEFLDKEKGFRFDKFTPEQMKRYGIK